MVIDASFPRRQRRLLRLPRWVLPALQARQRARNSFAAVCSCTTNTRKPTPTARSYATARHPLPLDHSRRPLLHALLASVAVHAAVLASGPATRVPVPPRAALQVVIASLPAEPPPNARAAEPARPLAAPRPASAAVAASPAVQHAITVPTRQRDTAAERSSAIAGAPAEAASSGATAAVGPPASASDGPRPDALREYRLALAIEARRFKRYPPLARERGWEGTVEAAVSGGVAAVPLVSLERSSGYAALDEQTLDMLRRAALSTPLPESLRGHEFRVVVPVRFSLDNDK